MSSWCSRSSASERPRLCSRSLVARHRQGPRARTQRESSPGRPLTDAQHRASLPSDASKSMRVANQVGPTRPSAGPSEPSPRGTLDVRPECEAAAPRVGRRRRCRGHRAVPQPRAFLAGLQRARARARVRPDSSPARTRQVLRDLRLELGRVLHDPCGRALAGRRHARRSGPVCPGNACPVRQRVLDLEARKETVWADEIQPALLPNRGSPSPRSRISTTATSRNSSSAQTQGSAAHPVGSWKGTAVPVAGTSLSVAALVHDPETGELRLAYVSAPPGRRDSRASAPEAVTFRSSARLSTSFRACFREWNSSSTPSSG